MRWEISSGESRALDRVRAQRALAVSPDNALAACGADNGVIQIYDLERDEVVGTIPGASEGALDAAVDATGGSVATGHQNGSIQLYALGEGGTRRTLHGAHTFMAYALCRIGAHRFASGAFDGTIRVWDFDSAEPLDTFSHAGRPIAVTFVPHVVPMTRGILATVVARNEAGLTSAEVLDVFAAHLRLQQRIRLENVLQPGCVQVSQTIRRWAGHTRP